MLPWKKAADDRLVYDGWRKIISKKLVLPNGNTEDFGAYCGSGDCAAVIGITNDSEVVIARQFRYGPEEFMDEIPGGWPEANETPTDCATREFTEETGYIFDNIEKLGSVYKDANFTYKHHYFLAKGCVKNAEQHTDDDEFIEVKLIDIDELIKNAKTGKMTDQVAILMAYDELLKIKENQ